jgi:phage shock protein E
MRRPELLIFLLLSCFSLDAQDTDSVKYESLDPYYFHLEYLKDDSSLLVDVREFFEYRRNRIQDAVNIPSSRYLNKAADTLSKSYSLFLYCTDGWRSKRALELFYDRGFRKLYNLEGGLQAWRREDYPIEKKNIPRRKKL